MALYRGPSALLLALLASQGRGFVIDEDGSEADDGAALLQVRAQAEDLRPNDLVPGQALYFYTSFVGDIADGHLFAGDKLAYVHHAGFDTEQVLSPVIFWNGDWTKGDVSLWPLSKSNRTSSKGDTGYSPQYWFISPGPYVSPKGDTPACITAPKWPNEDQKWIPRVELCWRTGDQQWYYDTVSFQIRAASKNLCLNYDPKYTKGGHIFPTLEPCKPYPPPTDDNHWSQMWYITSS